MWRLERIVGVLALGLLGCTKIEPGESGIRGRVPVHEDSWAVPGEQICAWRPERRDDPTCATVRRDGSFELRLPRAIYSLCVRDGRKHALRCPSLCRYPVHAGEVTEVEPANLLTPKPDGQGFYGTSSRSLGPGHVDMPHLSTI